MIYKRFLAQAREKEASCGAVLLRPSQRYTSFLSFFITKYVSVFYFVYISIFLFLIESFI